MPNLSPPALSVVVVTPERFRNIRRTVRHLRAQTARDRLELILVAPSEDALDDHEPYELEGFHSVQRVGAGPIENVDKASGHGILAAQAPAVAIIEDHAFPDAEWAEAQIEAHRGPWAVVGSTMMNANPRSPLSWTNLLIAYGWWTDPVEAGEVEALPGHNVSFKRDVLTRYGDALFDRLGRDGGLLEELRREGHGFYLAPGRVAHLNPSRLASTADLRFSAGRLYGARRAQSEGWSAAKRALYTVAGPLIPAVRFRRVREEMFGGDRRRALAPKVYPALLLGLVLDGLGQMAGYALGPGRSVEKLSTFEMDRIQHLDRKDRQANAG